MKAIYTVLIVIACAGLVFYACKKDNPAPIDTTSPPESNSIIKGKMDGVSFSITPENTALEYEYDPNLFPSGDSSTLLYIQGGVPPSKYVRLRFRWSGFIDYPNNNFAVRVDYFDGTEYHGDLNPNVNITEIDTLKKLLSGTFEAESYDSESQEYHYLTNGVFTNINF